MRVNELQQIHARFFNSSKSNPTKGNCSDKTYRKKTEKARIKYGFLLWSSKKLVRGQLIGNTFVGSVRDTFNLKPINQTTN